MKSCQLGLFMLSAVCLSLHSFASTPVVSDVVMTQETSSRKVTISYELKDSPGIVTLDILTNGVSIGAENIQYLSGDVNARMEIGKHTITWRPDLAWEGFKAPETTARVYAWTEATPPNYMALDLVEPYAVHYYVSEKALPGGITNDIYRSSKLLMRKIKQPNGGRWMMGSVCGEQGRAVGKIEEGHYVTLTNDYWIGVFEVTQKQWAIIKGKSNQARYPGSGRPVEQLSYRDIRGDSDGTYFPADPSADSFLQRLRQRTGKKFDLPSEMQWEYACRAGTSSALNNGEGIFDSAGQKTSMNPLGRHLDNGGSTEYHARVGSYQPNAWGLYDMHGNVGEYCLDWYTNDITRLDGAVYVPSDPSGFRTIRGGSYSYPAEKCRSAARLGVRPTDQYNPNFGFRCVCPVEE